MSVPVTIRRRWKTSRVAIDDNGDHIVVRPVSDDPVSALLGFAEGRGPTSDEVREELRREEREREDERYGPQ